MQNLCCRLRGLIHHLLDIALGSVVPIKVTVHSKLGGIMSASSSFLSRNIMLVGNLAANAAGLLVFLIIKQFGVSLSSTQADLVLFRAHSLYFSLAFFFLILVTRGYETPIRIGLARLGKEKIDSQFLLKIRQRVLNEPFFLLGLDILIWIGAAFFHAYMLHSSGITGKVMIRIFAQALLVGIFTTTLAFFILERILKHYRVGVFFPEGGLYKIPGTLRIRIRTRLIALLVGINVMPLAAFFLMSLATVNTDFRPDELILIFRRAVQMNVLGFAVMGGILVLLVTVSLTRPFSDIIERLGQIKAGNFEGEIQVWANDEIGYTSDMINEMAKGLREREKIKETFGKYVAKEIRDEVLSGRVSLDGEQKEVTVLFADLQDFTPFIEQSDPKHAVEIMNLYFKEMEAAVSENKGLVLQYIGDEIYAVFGAPVSDAAHPTHGVMAAMAMQKRLEQLNETFTQRGWPCLTHRIGLHSGTALAANMGSPSRMSYLLVGNTVNIAARLQSLNKRYGTGILLSQETRGRLEPDRIASAVFTPLGEVVLKGIANKVSVFSLSPS